jgi:hypothetical protein
MGVKSFISKITGVDQLKQELTDELERAKKQREEAQQLKLDAELEAEQAMIDAEAAKKQSLLDIEEARQAAEVARMSPKDQATRRNEPWVGVLDTKVNEANPRNGFFELDWNKPFIDMLIKHEYGFESDPEEEIVDRWFRDLAYNVLQESDLDTDRGYGYINVQKLTENHSEIK